MTSCSRARSRALRWRRPGHSRSRRPARARAWRSSSVCRAPLEFHESPRVTLARRLDVPRRLRRRATTARRGRGNAPRASGDEGTRAHVLFHRFQVEWFSGRWDEADRLATDALRTRRAAARRAIPRHRAVRPRASRRSPRPRRRGPIRRDGVPGDRRIPRGLAVRRYRAEPCSGSSSSQLGDPEAADRHLRELPRWLDSHGWASRRTSPGPTRSRR